MRKTLYSIFLLPLIFGFSFGQKSSKNVEFTQNNPQIVRISRANPAIDFVNYWKDVFRKPDIPVCDISREAYFEMYAKYIELNKEERAYVNAQPDIDEDYTIGDVIKTLTQKYYPNSNKTKNEKKKLDQSSIIVIAVVVALVGATSISILFILRNQKVIK